MATFSDAQLISILQKSARRVNRKLNLFGSTNEIVVDSSGCMTNPSGDGELEDILLLQAECMVSQRNLLEIAGSSNSDGILMIDGEQQLDTRTKAQIRIQALSSNNSPCVELSEAIKDYLLDQCFGIDIW